MLRSTIAQQDAGRHLEHPGAKFSSDRHPASTSRSATRWATGAGW